MIMQTLGDTFRLAREKRKVTVSQAAAATHMMMKHVEAIENNQYQKFAASAYARGFIKLYAEYLGLDPAPLIREYVERYMPQQRHSIMPNDAPAAPVPEAAPPAAEPAGVGGTFPSIAIPKIDLRRKLTELSGKISALASVASGRARKISWRRPAMAAGAVALLWLVIHLARMSGAEAGKTAAARPAHAPPSMSLIIQDPPDPYLKLQGGTP